MGDGGLMKPLSVAREYRRAWLFVLRALRQEPLRSLNRSMTCPLFS